MAISVVRSQVPGSSPDGGEGLNLEVAEVSDFSEFLALDRAWNELLDACSYGERLAPGILAVIPNGVELQRFAPAGKRSALRAEFGVAASEGCA